MFKKYFTIGNLKIKIYCILEFLFYLYINMYIYIYIYNTQSFKLLSQDEIMIVPCPSRACNHAGNMAAPWLGTKAVRLTRTRTALWSHQSDQTKRWSKQKPTVSILKRLSTQFVQSAQTELTVGVNTIHNHSNCFHKMKSW